MTKIILMVVVLFVTAIGLSYAYADEFRFGFLPENLVNNWTEINYKIGNDGGYDVWIQQNSVFHYDTIYDAPEQIHFQTVGSTGSVKDYVTFDIRKNVELLTVPEPEPEPQKPALTPEMQAGIDEKIEEREKTFEEALRCLYGNEGNSMFQATNEERIAKEKIAFRSLPVDGQQAKLIKAREACDVFFEDAKMISESPEMMGKFKAQQQAELEDKQREAKLERSTDYTDPLTQEDFDETIETAENFMCSVTGKQRGLCITEFEGVNRGGYTEGAECGTTPNPTGPPTVVCPLKEYNELISTAVSVEDNYINVQKLVCERYLNQYQHLVERIRSGDETAILPNWLAHCEV